MARPLGLSCASARLPPAGWCAMGLWNHLPNGVHCRPKRGSHHSAGLRLDLTLRHGRTGASRYGTGLSHPTIPATLFLCSASCVRVPELTAVVDSCCPCTRCVSLGRQPWCVGMMSARGHGISIKEVVGRPDVPARGISADRGRRHGTVATVVAMKRRKPMSRRSPSPSWPSTRRARRRGR